MCKIGILLLDRDFEHDIYELIKAFYPEVPISVDASACAGVTPQSHKNALEAMKMCQIDIVNE